MESFSSTSSFRCPLESSVGRRAPKLQRLVKEAALRGTRLLLMPDGMARRDGNTTTVAGAPGRGKRFSNRGKGRGGRTGGGRGRGGGRRSYGIGVESDGNSATIAEGEAKDSHTRQRLDEQLDRSSSSSTMGVDKAAGEKRDQAAQGDGAVEQQGKWDDKDKGDNSSENTAIFVVARPDDSVVAVAGMTAEATTGTVSTAAAKAEVRSPGIPSSQNLTSTAPAAPGGSSALAPPTSDGAPVAVAPALPFVPTPSPVSATPRTVSRELLEIEEAQGKVNNSTSNSNSNGSTMLWKLEWVFCAAAATSMRRTPGGDKGDDLSSGEHQAVRVADIGVSEALPLHEVRVLGMVEIAASRLRDLP